MDAVNGISTTDDVIHRPSTREQRLTLSTETISVIDVPFERTKHQPQVVLKIHHGEELALPLATLPQQQANTARVFTVPESIYFPKYSNQYESLIQHWVERYPDLEHRTDFIKKGFRSCEISHPTADFGIISSQWKQGIHEDPCGDEYATISTETDLRHRDWFLRSSVVCLAHGHDQLLVFNIRDRGALEPAGKIFDPWEDVLISNKSFVATANGGKDNAVKLLLLDLFAANIYLQPRATLTKLSRLLPMTSVILNYSGAGVFDDYLTFDQHDNVDHYETSLTQHEKTLDALRTLADAIDFVVDALKMGAREGAIPVNSCFDPEKVSLLQKLCHQRLESVQRSMDRQNRALEARDKIHNIHESVSVKRLTILATIFLPLSLSASILSIQTRFADLQLRLYDFVGVFVIVGSAAVLMLLLVRLVLKVKHTGAFEQYSPYNLWTYAGSADFPYGNKRFHRVQSMSLAMSYTLAWTVVLVSFIIGMLKNVILGLEILGYGFAGTLVVMLVGLPWVIWKRRLVNRVEECWDEWNRWKARERTRQTV